MLILKKWDKSDTYMYPNGAIATGEKIATDYPAVEVFMHVIETDENCQVCYAIENLSGMRSRYNIDTSLSDDDAISEIQDIMNAPKQVNTEPSAEERIAAALEAQVIMSMPDEETV